LQIVPGLTSSAFHPGRASVFHADGVPMPSTTLATLELVRPWLGFCGALGGSGLLGTAAVGAGAAGTGGSVGAAGGGGSGVGVGGIGVAVDGIVVCVGGAAAAIPGEGEAEAMETTAGVGVGSADFGRTAIMPPHAARPPSASPLLSRPGRTPATPGARRTSQPRARVLKATNSPRTGKNSQPS
jgi:hypothetical protein